MNQNKKWTQRTSCMNRYGINWCSNLNLTLNIRQWVLQHLLPYFIVDFTFWFVLLNFHHSLVSRTPPEPFLPGLQGWYPWWYVHFSVGQYPTHALGWGHSTPIWHPGGGSTVSSDVLSGLLTSILPLTCSPAKHQKNRLDFYLSPFMLQLNLQQWKDLLSDMFHFTINSTYRYLRIFKKKTKT